MRWSSRALLAMSLTLVGSATSGAEVIPAAEAARHVGSQGTVEGDVAAVAVEADTVVLSLAPSDPKGFRAVLVLSLISALPRDPSRIYAEKRVRVTGMIQRFAGRPEMVLESPSQIEVVDVAGAPPRAASTTSSTVPSPTVPPRATTPPTAAAPTPASAPPPPSADLRPRLAQTLADESCRRARNRWTAAAATLRAATAALDRCLTESPYRCRSDAAAITPKLAELEWAEQDVAGRCP